jgi:hypothetical protein
MLALVRERNAVIKQIAESSEWRHYLARHFHHQGHSVSVLSRSPHAPWRVIPWDGVTLSHWIEEPASADRSQRTCRFHSYGPCRRSFHNHGGPGATIAGTDEPHARRSEKRTRSSVPSSPRSLKAAAWGWRSAIPSWNRMVVACGPRLTTDGARPSTSHNQRLSRKPALP